MQKHYKFPGVEVTFSPTSWSEIRTMSGEGLDVIRQKADECLTKVKECFQKLDEVQTPKEKKACCLETRVRKLEQDVKRLEFIIK